MASLATLHIGRPCHVKCTPKALDQPSWFASWALSALGRGRSCPAHPTWRSWYVPWPRQRTCTGGARSLGPYPARLGPRGGHTLQA